VIGREAGCAQRARVPDNLVRLSTAGLIWVSPTPLEDGRYDVLDDALTEQRTSSDVRHAQRCSIRLTAAGEAWCARRFTVPAYLAISA
jgi:hypothetical protein